MTQVRSLLILMIKHWVNSVYLLVCTMDKEVRKVWCLLTMACANLCAFLGEILLGIRESDPCYELSLTVIDRAGTLAPQDSSTSWYAFVEHPLTIGTEKAQNRYGGIFGAIVNCACKYLYCM